MIVVGMLYVEPCITQEVVRIQHWGHLISLWNIMLQPGLVYCVMLLSFEVVHLRCMCHGSQAQRVCMWVLLSLCCSALASKMSWHCKRTHAA